MASELPGETRSERKRNHILSAAKDVFAREGFSHTGMEQVARSAGVSTATLYAYFPSKAELFRIVVEETIAEMAQRVRASVEKQGDARARLQAFSVAYAKFYMSQESRALVRMVIAERRRFPELAEHFNQRGRTELAGSLLAVISELAEAGEIAITKPSWASGQLQGMIEHSTLLLGLVAGDEVQPLRTAEQIADDAVTTFLARYAVRGKAA